MRLKLSTSIGLVVAAIASVLAIPTSASPASAAEFVWGTFQSYQNGDVYLSTYTASGANNTRVVTFGLRGLNYPGTDQQWQVKESNSTLYGPTIKNATSWRSLGVSAGSTSSNASVVIFNENTSTDQDWTLDWVGISQYRIVNVKSKKCLSIAGAAPNNNSQVVIWPCSGTEDQIWIWKPLSKW